MKIETSGPNYIELLGIFGDFETPNSDYVVHYFSTFANNRNPGDFHHQLLEELMPMRERLSLDKIEDLSTLLQRDLNDVRVAEDLVPYLKNQVEDKSHVAFFPAILGVLIPENFINESETNSIYPSPKKLADGTISFGDDWKVEYFKDGSNNPTSLGKLMLNLKKTDVVVIDGQHRANAFRVLANTFNRVSSKKQSVYDIFYENVDKPPVYNADLPVPLIWFETKNKKNKIVPNLISRKLFVDVNNTAKRVNQSRTILLNDKDPASVLTRLFYSKLAKEDKFSVNKFSLLHSGFDVDTGLKNSSPHSLTLTTPEIMNYCFDWFFFGKRDYTKLDKDKAGSRVRRKENEPFNLYIGNPSNYIEFGTNIDDDYYKRLKTDANIKELTKLFDTNISPAILHLFNEFSLLKAHFDACEKVSDWRKNSPEGWSIIESEAWDYLFLGGEGLYYVFNSLDKPSGQAKNLQKGAQSLLKKFSAERAKLMGVEEIKDVDDSFKSVRSYAFQLGMFMAVDYHFRNNNKFKDLKEAVVDFVKKLGAFSGKEWIYILTKVRGTYIGNVDPKSWPAYQNLFIRLIQSGAEEYFNAEDYKEYSPDAVIFKNFFIGRCKDYVRKKYRMNLKDVDYEEIKSELPEFIKEAKKDLEELFDPLSNSNSNFKVMDLEYDPLAYKVIKSLVNYGDDA